MFYHISCSFIVLLGILVPKIKLDIVFDASKKAYTSFCDVISMRQFVQLDTNVTNVVYASF